MNTVQDVIRQKRESFRVNIRKERTEETFKQKRQMFRIPRECDPHSIEQHTRQWYATLVDRHQAKDEQGLAQLLSTVKEFLFQGDGFLQLKLQAFHKINFIDLLNLVFVECESKEVRHLVIECMVNLFSLDVLDDVQQLSHKPFMAGLFELANEPECQATVWYLLSNLSANNSEQENFKRKILIDFGVIGRIEELWKLKRIDYGEDNLTNLTWLFSNLVDRGGALSIKHTERVINLCGICISCDYTMVQQHCLEVFLNASQKHDNLISYINSINQLSQQIITLTQSPKLQWLAINTLANMCAGKDRDICILLDFGILSALEQYYITCTNPKPKNIVVWALANLCAIQDIDRLFEVVRHPIMRRVINDTNQLDSTGCYEYMYLCRNLSLMQDAQLLRYNLLMENFIESVLHMVQKPDAQLVILGLEVVCNFAHYFSKTSLISGANVAIEFFNARGLEQLLNQLQTNDNQTIGASAVKVFEMYYL